MRGRIYNCIKRASAIMLCIVLNAAVLTPLTVHAEKETKTVIVGWYESPFNTTGSTGRRSGYAYEYQMRIAAYAGWEYTYITGSWPDLMQMLTEGKIDLMSDVSYTEERAQNMLFSDLAMGTEEYCIFISPDNTDITSDDYSTLNGRRIGVNAGSVQESLYQSWAEKHGVQAEIVPLTCEEEESMDMLASGLLDALISLNAYGDPEKLAPVCKIGSSDFFFAVGKDRADLLSDLNAAMSRIHDETPYYNQQMFEKYVQRFGTNAFLSPEEKAWLSSHDTIRVGYQDNYLAFCAQDPETGELTGALKNYLKDAADCITDTHLNFETTAYPTSDAAFEALRKGEIDCVFPSTLNSYDGEEQGVLMTPSLMRSEIYAIVRQSDPHRYTAQEHVIVAVNEGNTNYTAFLKENYPEWRAVYYPSTAECLKAVSDSVADCVLISSFRFSNLSRLCNQYRLTDYDTGAGLDYCISVAEGETELYSILSKTVGLVPASTTNAALNFYISEDAKVTLSDYVSDNLGVFLALIAAVLLGVILLLLKSRQTVKKAKELISATETDRLTGLYNRDYFFQYADRMYRESPHTPRDAVVLNIEQFHSINALNGRDFGDRVLRVLGSEIFVVAGEYNGIGGRFGADRFDIYCRHIENYQSVFDRLQHKIEVLAPNASVRLRMGVMPWQENIEPVQLFDRARTACNMARGNYMEHLIVFDEKIRERELLDQKLLNDLRRALDDHEFEVYYQPKFDISAEEPQLVGAEALIRWQHPQMGKITPDNFIPLFERNGKITELDKYVWSRAAAQVSDWRTRFDVTVPVSVNLSRVDIFDNELEATLDNILKREGLAHDALKLEITESAYTENAGQLIHVVKALHKKGYIIEMDDFGTGYSSLNMLSAMPIDVLKMDKAFVRNIETNQKDTQMVSLIIGIAKNMDIPVIAEGVETESQIRLLKELGCIYVQGYYFSRPLQPSDFEEQFLHNKNH